MEERKVNVEKKDFYKLAFALSRIEPDKDDVCHEKWEKAIKAIAEISSAPKWFSTLCGREKWNEEFEKSKSVLNKNNTMEALIYSMESTHNKRGI
jgi:DNA-directed RNA polymerase specialized sigma24 family protein